MTIKKVVVIEMSEFNTIGALIHDSLIDVDKLPDSPDKENILSNLEQVYKMIKNAY